ncbi:uncharacterized protein KY384_006057 [Bacidia gigantensis]|uniref:uncharacterized protein n=1 Tax=Bacidia gigantensis TaxID=2732470 RepID=UPI001D03E476|nr:uncharacterized protein KY384_006057 [Bacidia gigantensis]KAG8529420.1 hypothetical protein KY384_006057 [Bacidia gigantensis]
MDSQNVATNLEDLQSSGSKRPEQADRNSTESNAASRPLAPPPRPSQPQSQSKQVDYFSGAQQEGAHFSQEPNPFEKSFGQPSSEASDSKSLLPPVAALTSPAPLQPEGSSTSGYNFASSLRAGPLSPAMLGGPVGSGTDYFGPQAGTAFPGVTPNESSLRTGLTPGGGGSMFPAPSPNSQAFIQSLAGGGATPSTIDFHRTAINAAAANKNKQYGGNSSAPQESKNIPASSMDPLLQQQPAPQSTFGQHDNDAANGLYLLAQATNGQQASQYSSLNNNTANHQRQNIETSPNMRNARNGSLNGSTHGSGDLSDEGSEGRMATRSKGKRSSGGKNISTSNGRRKAEDNPLKQPPSKKQRNLDIMDDMQDMDSDDDDMDIKEEPQDTRKMTDEEKRKNFLERNRVAALKCRQRKKQWLQNLQNKVEMFSTENDSLTAQVHALREEIVGLKTLLIQHKDCPISQSQGITQYFQQQQEFNPHAHPYGMGLPNGHQNVPGRGR